MPRTFFSINPAAEQFNVMLRTLVSTIFDGTKTVKTEPVDFGPPAFWGSQDNLTAPGRGDDDFDGVHTVETHHHLPCKGKFLHGVSLLSKINF
jgi:hypothetical protein